MFNAKLVITDAPFFVVRSAPGAVLEAPERLGGDSGVSLYHPFKNEAVVVIAGKYYNHAVVKVYHH